MTVKRPPSIYEQLMAAASHAAMHPDLPRVWPLNPFPVGVRLGSFTDWVLSVAVAAHPKWLEAEDLRRLTGGSRGAIAWACRYLQEHGQLRATQSIRHPSYLRYQAVMEDPNENRPT